MLRYQAKLEPAEEGGYLVSFPDIPACITEGDNFEHAVEMAQEVLDLWLEGARDENWPIPKSKAPRKGKKYHWIVPNHKIQSAIYIRQARLKSGLSQGNLAKRMGVSVQVVQRLENPRLSNPTVKQIWNVCLALNIQLPLEMDRQELLYENLQELDTDSLVKQLKSKGYYIVSAPPRSRQSTKVRKTKKVG